MNGKRQTIWLVSMLSLMVVLSAYYLFTEDSGSTAPKVTAGTIQVDAVKNSADAEPQVASGDGAAVTEVTDGATDPAASGSLDGSAAADNAGASDSVSSSDGGSSADSTAADGTDKNAGAADSTDSAQSGQKTPAKGDAPSADADRQTAAQSGDAAKSGDGTATKTDEEVLNQVASQSASTSAMFDSYAMEREQQIAKQHDDLLAIMNDMDKSPAESAAASEKLSKLEDREAIIESIESKLQKQFGEAVVKEDGNDAYKVVVLSDKLDAKQAAGIIDLVIKELNVSQDKISVQHVSEQ